MARTKKESPEKAIKAKTLFDHINQVTQHKKKDYWTSLSEADKKTFSVYMVNKFLSMNVEYVELINEIQTYNLQPKQLYDVLMDLLPKKKVWSKYIKGSTRDEESVKILSEHYELGMRDVNFLLKLMSDDDVEILIKNVKNKYGERFNTTKQRKKG